MAEYIEREALLAAYDATHKGAAGGARKLMVDAPAADVAPVRHGRWKTYDARNCYIRCSECRYSPIFRTNYCPNCGARTDLEDNK